jgi:hypothetical protein
MPARLKITDTHYTLSVQNQGKWVELTTLDGGAQSIVPGHAEFSGAVLEHAIDVAEGWIMPHAKALRGEALYVDDTRADVKAGLHAVLSVDDEQFTVQAIEACFLRVVDMSTGRFVSPLLNNRQKFVAHLVLLRELAHHGGLSDVFLVCGPAPAFT